MLVTLALIAAAIVVGSVPAAAASKAGVPSASFARLDLGSGAYDGTAAGSAGLVYVIHPATVPLPANVEGLDKNW